VSGKFLENEHEKHRAKKISPLAARTIRKMNKTTLEYRPYFSVVFRPFYFKLGEFFLV